MSDVPSPMPAPANPSTSLAAQLPPGDRTDALDLPVPPGEDGASAVRPPGQHVIAGGSAQHPRPDRRSGDRPVLRLVSAGGERTRSWEITAWDGGSGEAPAQAGVQEPLALRWMLASGLPAEPPTESPGVLPIPRDRAMEVAGPAESAHAVSEDAATPGPPAPGTAPAAAASGRTSPPAGADLARRPPSGARRAAAVTRAGAVGARSNAVGAGLRLVPPLPPIPELPVPDPALPPPAPWVARLARTALEIIAGDRPAQQLKRWVAPELQEQLAHRAAAAQRHPAGRDGAARTARQVRCVRVCPISPTIVEAAAVVTGGVRSRAVAIRLEAVAGRWLATAIEVG